ncbi:YicC/YloC family endoribonuclease [Thermocaproicibacter melissae]|uniref:YicC/YloC family endoribonuclease n=1 Tax=Thermocaproicibacter melissae TaxID=2966552 RepID=UPI0024B21CA0|nr:YicC/YloC family endoribonuclease [Thermocaproicibacter melissae]WBY63344.1 YicC family protein [Thermocaproicibacter melissae]
MINSMTGFGRAEETVNGRDIIVEIKSVNHRFFDFSARVPRAYGFLEDRLKKYLQGRIQRGKIDVFVDFETVDDVSAQVTVNHTLAAGYVNALRELSSTYGLKDDITAGMIAKFPDVLVVSHAPEDEDAVWQQVCQVLEKALVPFFAMRAAEGEKMKEDVLSRANTIQKIVGCVEERSPQTVEEYRRRLSDRITELTAAGADEQRILTETAIFADKVSVAEETVRLRSHIAQFSDMLAAGGAVGRRLDFLVQEMNREANTIGSKCVDAQIAHYVVDMKAEIEKIREQIQNIE